MAYIKITREMRRQLNRVRKIESKMVWKPKTKDDHIWLKGFWTMANHAKQRGYVTVT